MMKNKFLLLTTNFLFLASTAQVTKSSVYAKDDINRPSLSDSIKKYFNYDTLKYFSCNQTPPGIYAINFKVNTRQKAYEFEFSEDSLPVLKNLFIKALDLALKKCSLPKSDKRYLQLIYYDNYLNCINWQDTVGRNSESIDNIYKEGFNLLGSHIFLLEKTFANLIIKEASESVVLKTVVINNDNPNHPHLRREFRNDYKVINENDYPKEKLDRILKALEKKKLEKQKEGK